MRATTGLRRESPRKPPLCAYSAAWFGDEAAEVTFNIGHIAGGSHAGWKRQKPAPTAWECECKMLNDDVVVTALEVAGLRMSAFDEPKTQPAYMARCPDCGTRRNG